ncbi:MAG: hypothetical protein PS018_26520 [bacterium]|nr:hypothetical protein [bacterium]
MTKPDLKLVVDGWASTASSLKGGDGGGTSDGMEPRVKALEDKFDKIDAKLDGLGKDVSYLKGKVDAMPTTLQLGGFIIAVLAIAGLAKYLAP